jgi:ribosome-associated translation inhibitor RaiA
MLKNLKSLFIVEDESASKRPKTAKAKGAAVKQETKPVGPQKNDSTTASMPLKGTATSKFRDILFKAIEQNNLEGFDYLEFRNSLLSLEKMVMDEKTRYKSAAAMAETLGVTPEQILKSADHYLNVLKAEEQKFQQALDNQKLKQIGSKQQQLKKLDEVVKQKSVRIQQLQKEIEADQKKAAQVSAQIEKATVKVRQTSADFEASFASVANRIAEDVEKIKNYLANKNQK